MRLSGHIFKIILPVVFLLGTALSHAQIQVTPVPSKQPAKAPVAQSPARKAANEEMLMADRARRAELSGDYSRALAIWNELLTRSPWNPEALPGVPRCMMVLKQYDQCEAFLKDYIQKSRLRTGVAQLPSDPTSPFGLNLLLGQLALVRGDETKAWDIWNAALAETGRSPDAVRSLILTLQQNRRWEQSERLIRDYRKETKDPAFMSLELAMSLRGQMNWVAATEELILFSGSQPTGWQMAMNYLNQFPADTSVAEKVASVLHKAVQHDRKNDMLWKLVAGWGHRTGDYDEYLSATITADSLSNGGGFQVLQASEQMLQEEDVELARTGFQKVLAWKPAADVQARAELGLGKCLEDLNQWDSARQAYEGFIKQHPNFKEIDEAKFRIGEILLNHDRNPSGALAIYQSLWKSNSRALSRPLVGMRIGDCYAFDSKFDSAISAWTMVVKSQPGPLTDDGAVALVRIARANLWRDSTNKALDVLDSVLAGNPVNMGFNDAVLYSSLLSDGGFYRAVRAFAEGDFAEFRREDSVAVGKFDEAANLLKEGRLAEWARFSQAKSLRAIGQAQLAIAALDTFVADYPESVDLDRAVYTRAVIRMEDLHDDKTALAEFQQFLIDHPRSMYLEQARRRARILTGRVS
jgi:tetratricopeptide (TPR) repeat protein